MSRAHELGGVLCRPSVKGSSCQGAEPRRERPRLGRASAAPRPVKGSFTSRFRVSVFQSKSGRRLPANVGERAARLRARVVATIEHSNAPRIGSAIRRRQDRVSVLRAGIGRCHSRCMSRRDRERMSEAEVHALFDRLFPRGCAGHDVLDEIAPEGWERSPLLACFHPSIERIFEERLLMHRNLEELRRLRRRRDGTAADVSSPEPTLEDVRKGYEPSPVEEDAEVTDLVGLCLWDTFSDNHEVIAADGRLADIGSFRGAGAFIDEHLTRDRDGGREGDYMRFYMGTIWIGQRADLAPVYTMIFSRLRAVGADWVYHFPELGIVELPSRDDDPARSGAGYSVSQSAVAELNAQHRRAEVPKLRAELEEANASAREEALDREPPAIVRAYRQVYGRDPSGWPPA
jgi:hypothetical protein